MTHCWGSLFGEQTPGYLPVQRARDSLSSPWLRREEAPSRAGGAPSVPGSAARERRGGGAESPRGCLRNRAKEEQCDLERETRQGQREWRAAPGAGGDEGRRRSPTRGGAGRAAAAWPPSRLAAAAGSSGLAAARPRSCPPPGCPAPPSRRKRHAGPAARRVGETAPRAPPCSARPGPGADASLSPGNGRGQRPRGAALGKAGGTAGGGFSTACFTRDGTLRLLIVSLCLLHGYA